MIGVHQPMRDLPGLAAGLLLFERVDEFDGGEEADPPVVMLDRLHAQGRGHVRLACAGAADQHDILGVLQELASMQLPHECFVDLAVAKSKPVRSR